jgi:hypothetical protein
MRAISAARPSHARCSSRPARGSAGAADAGGSAPPALAAAFEDAARHQRLEEPMRGRGRDVERAHHVAVLDLAATVHEAAHLLCRRRHEAILVESPHYVEVIIPESPHLASAPRRPLFRITACAVPHYRENFAHLLVYLV